MEKGGMEKNIIKMVIQNLNSKTEMEKEKNIMKIVI